MQRLTEKQIEVLQMIHDFTADHSYPPTIQELAEQLGVRSKNAVVKHIDALRKKGHIVKDSSTARGIRIVNKFYLQPDEEVQESNEIPLIGRVAAGMPILAVENIEKHITVPNHMIKRNAVYYALRVQGESMIDAGIHNQDIVIVEKNN
ncbi:MAG: transcriptional repressor LexA, partial [Calditrichaeota bacterium]|nr:transcriptional repressor LexA [Calditrichota bacterium]